MRAFLSAMALLLTFTAPAQRWQTVFEKSKGTQTPAYQEIIEFYRQLDKASPKIRLEEMGGTDAGFPLHLVLYCNEGKFSPATWHRANKVVLLINNGIHPGEPDGIDASMLLLRDLVTGKKKIPDNIALAIIPVYNIGGCLNRSTLYRVDQNGPEAFGSRGNSQNLDLNRDFIKCDSKEARSFAGIFHYLDPDIFIDNHVSNGADYQHIMTLISSQHSKLGGEMGQFMNRQFEPGLYTLMKEKGYDLVPYVNFTGETPDNGWPEFFDSPRYSSGFAALWNSFGFTTETHMLKPYNERVQSTYALLECFIDFAAANHTQITRIRRQTRQSVQTQPMFTLAWKLDSTRYAEITFKGYEAGKKPSAVSGLPRLYYDRSKPYEKKVRLYNQYVPAVTVRKPEAYMIPQGWWKVIELLKANRVEMHPLQADTTLTVEAYHITDYKTTPRQYEMHHPNSEVKLTATREVRHFRKGDVYIAMNQAANRFITEVLEPQSSDSYFAWNYFDAILGQKEGISNYAYEDTAAIYLQQHPELKEKLLQQRAADTAFAGNANAQLQFVFRNSPYFEPQFMRYPVYRLVK